MMRLHSLLVLVLLSITVSFLSSNGCYAYDEKSDYHQENVKEYPNQRLNIDQDSTQLDQWLQSETIGKYLNVHKIKDVSVVIPVNFVFVGFNGDGNNAFNMNLSVLIDWFEHLEHALPNVIVPYGEDYTTSETTPTPSSKVEYIFDIQVSKTDPIVTTLIEDTIYWNLRAENLDIYKDEGVTVEDDGQNVYYTDPTIVSTLLSSLTTYLGIAENSYTIYILNPNKPNGPDNKYGYRTGISNQELKLLHKHQSQDNIFEERSKVYGYDYFAKSTTFINNHEAGEVIASSKSPTIKYKNIGLQSREWGQEMVNRFSEANRLDGDGNSINNTDDEQRPSNRYCQFNQENGEASCITLTEEELESPIIHAKRLLNEGTPLEKFYISSAYQYRLSENCLVDSWLSYNRFSFIDLTAGPFEWGPTIGGNGLKSNRTLPIVPLVKDFTEKDINQQSVIDFKNRLNDELTLIEAIYMNTCEMNQDSASIEKMERCVELMENIEVLKNAIKEQVKDEDISLDLILGNTKEMVEDEQVNQFKSHLSSLLSDSLRHLIAQPQPLFKINYSNRVNFHLFIISNHNSYDPRDSFKFNFDHFKTEIEFLKSPNQEFTFTIKTILMANEPSLSLAYHNSLKTVVQPTISDDGKFETKLQYYIDSKEIKYQLTRLNPDHHTEEDNQIVMESKHIPIFIFSLDSEHPVFIDKSLQAKTLNNMVIAVQTNIYEYETTTFACNGKRTKIYLGNPTSAILSATATALGGLVPNYLSYNYAQQTATQDWQWSVGNSPSSRTHTFPFAHFSEFHVDSLHRNYIVASLDRSIKYTNHASKILLNLKTTSSNYRVLDKYPISDLEVEFKHIKDQWDQISNLIKGFDYTRAIQLAIESEKQSYIFLKRTVEMSEAIELNECENPVEYTSGNTMGVVMITMCLNVIFVLALLLLRNRKSKIKIN